MARNVKSVSFSIPEDLYHKLELEAQEMRLSRSAWLTLMLAQRFAKLGCDYAEGQVEQGCLSET